MNTTTLRRYLFLIVLLLIVTMMFEHSAIVWTILICVFIPVLQLWLWLDAAYNKWAMWAILRNVGAAMNMLAIAVNGGRMPVLGRTEVVRWWQPLTEQTRLSFLCDVYWTASLGDFIILTGALIWIAISIHGWIVKPIAQQKVV